jgi:hypothetical protein
MVLSKLLRDPDPAGNSAGGTPPPAAVPTAPQADLSRSTYPSASAALGLDEPPSKTIGSVFDENRRRNLPPVTAGITPPPAQTPTPPPAAPPVAPATPPAAPAAPAVTPPAEPAKDTVVIAGKEWKVADLEKVIAGQPQTPQPPVPQGAQPNPQQPPAAPQGPTADEIKKREADWVTANAKNFVVDLGLTKEGLETILGGGDEGVKAFTEMVAQGLSTVAARAVLEARKGIFGDLEQDFGRMDRLQQGVAQLLQERQQLAQYTTKQQFLHQYPEFKDYQEDALAVAEAILQKHPDITQRVTQEDFFKLVAQHTDAYLMAGLKRFNPSVQAKSWREYHSAIKAADQGTPTPGAPASPPPTPTGAVPPQPAAPAAPPAIPVRPPVANAPAAPTWQGYSRNEHKAIAATLID